MKKRVKQFTTESNVKITHIIMLLLIIGLFNTGCDQSPEPQFRINAIEKLSAEKMSLEDGETFSPNQVRQVGTILTAMFGTPNNPHFPLWLGEDDEGHKIISMDNLRMAAGPVSTDHSKEITGLYREHCAHCHGVSGDGAGPTAIELNPYPRDFRLGKFKFKSTPLGKRPTDSDLKRILVHGIPGTAMPSFRNLPNDYLDALIDYVKYLSIRGEVERLLLAQTAKLDKDEMLLDYSLKEDEETLEDFEDQLFDLFDDSGYRSKVLPKWLKRDRYVTEPPPAPASFSKDHEDHKQLVARGKELFHGLGGCVQCHGETGLGDGQTGNYDDWTTWAKNDTTVKPHIPSTYADYVAKGALPPRYVRPRNLRMRVFRGGNHPDDIYRRVVNGIEGTPMPSATALESTPDEIWAIVAYVKSMPYEPDNVVQEKPTSSKQIH